MIKYWLLSYPRDNMEITIKEKIIGGKNSKSYEKRYRDDIDIGDKIVLYISKDRKIKGSAIVIGEYFYDESIFWPPRNGEVWPHRRKIEIEHIYDIDEEKDIRNFYSNLDLLENARIENRVIGKTFGNYVRGLTPKQITEHDYLLLTNQLRTDGPNKAVKYFIFRTGSGAYEDIPSTLYHFKEGIPGYKQVLDAEKHGEFVYYERRKGGFWARGKIGEIRKELRNGVMHFFINIENFEEMGPISLDSIKGRLSFEKIGQAGIKRISPDDYQAIIGTQTPIEKRELKTLPEKISAAHLLSGKNLVLYGPPGTGKTRLAKLIAEAFCGERFTTVTANAEWSAYDVVGGNYISGQDSEQGGLGTAFKKGFLAEAASMGQTKPYWIIIDELNRANLDLAFGEAFTLLDIEHRNEIPLVRASETPGLSFKEDLYLPCSFRLIATMNSYDRAALFSLGYAFRRRFAFVEVPSPYEQIEEEDSLETAGINWQNLISEENSVYLSIFEEVLQWVKQQQEPPIIDPDQRIKDLDAYKSKLLQTFNALQSPPWNIFRLFYYLSKWITQQGIVRMGYAQTVDAIKFVLVFTLLEGMEPINICKAADYAFLSYFLPHLEYYLPKVRREKIGSPSNALKCLRIFEKLAVNLEENGLKMSSRRLRDIKDRLERFGDTTVF